MKARVKYVRSSSVRAMGEKTLGIPSWPGMDVLTPTFGHRPVLHRRELIPLHAAGARTEPATSLPIPILLPFSASRAPSPPVLPPGEYFGLCGFRDTPHKSFVDSKLNNVIGSAVLTCGIAPALFNSFSTTPSSAYGLKQCREYPTETSNPPTTIVSFRLTGMPASGPFRLTSFSSRAQDSASGRSSSVTQFVRACAIEAVLPYVRRISTAEMVPEWTSPTREAIGAERIEI